MMGSMHIVTAAPQQVHVHDMTRQHETTSHRLASDGDNRAPVSLVERIRTFLDRTLDAALGRFDH